MPNLAATDTGGAVGRRTHTLGLALFFPVIACGIAPVGVHPGADPRVVEEGSALPIALHGLS
ncbi:phosphate transporter [Burkholderia cenocepacia]|uniref:phosphate transporter n=1 Tax=Burkholderia cenocepacia TaxID=95486 RepID=UPI000F5BC87E|nr:phosphate transporter [Burkholderia cenocepacia]RQV04143.1 phosphate transporter [Burkholderia cenocepacia]